MMEFTAVQWILLAIGAMLLGLGKTGIPGVNIAFVPVLATILPARISTGFLLPMLIAGVLIATANSPGSVCQAMPATWSRPAAIQPRQPEPSPQHWLTQA